MLTGRCTNHPDRVAVGVCVHCRTPICIECSTPMEGIHRCSRCIARMGREAVRTRWEGSEAHPLTLLILLVSFVGLAFGWLVLAAMIA